MGDIRNDAKCMNCVGNMICDRHLRSGMLDCRNFSHNIQKLLNPKSKVDEIKDRIREEFEIVEDLGKRGLKADINTAMIHIKNLIEAVREEKRDMSHPAICGCESCGGAG